MTRGAGHFSADDLDALIQTAGGLGMAAVQRRSLLLAWMPVTVSGSLPILAAPLAQLRSDLEHLNAHGEPRHLATWLENANRLAPSKGAFDAWLERIPREPVSTGPGMDDPSALLAAWAAARAVERRDADGSGLRLAPAALAALQAVAVALTLADPERRVMLLEWMPDAVVEALPLDHRPAARLRADLEHLNALSDPWPLLIWLANAATIVGYLESLIGVVGEAIALLMGGDGPSKPAEVIERALVDRDARRYHLGPRTFEAVIAACEAERIYDWDQRVELEKQLGSAFFEQVPTMSSPALRLRAELHHVNQLQGVESLVAWLTGVARIARHALNRSLPILNGAIGTLGGERVKPSAGQRVRALFK